MGAIDPLIISNEQMLKSYFDKISKDRKFMLEFIFKCKKETKINDLQFVVQKQTQIEAKLWRLVKVVEDLISKQEIDSEFERLFKRLKIAIKIQKSLISIYDDKCLNAFQKLSEKNVILEEHYKNLKSKTN